MWTLEVYTYKIVWIILTKGNCCRNLEMNTQGLGILFFGFMTGLLSRILCNRSWSCSRTGSWSGSDPGTRLRLRRRLLDDDAWMGDGPRRLLDDWHPKGCGGSGKICRSAVMLFYILLWVWASRCVHRPPADLQGCEEVLYVLPSGILPAVLISSAATNEPLQLGSPACSFRSWPA